MSAVTLRIYDLSQGLARQFSPAILGKQIDAIYHTGVQVYDQEYYFGGGICADAPGSTPYGTPLTMQSMGNTSKTRAQFIHFLATISATFTMHTYHLLDNNCNNFSDACCHFLLQKHIPQHILDLPGEALNSPLGPIIRPLIDQMQAAITEQSEGHQLSLTPAGPSTSEPSAPAPAKRRYESFWSAPITLSSSANRPAILRKLNQTNPSLLVAPEPTISQLIHFALTFTDKPKTFPALDLLRLHALHTDRAKEIIQSLPALISRFIPPDGIEGAPRPAMTMTLRLITNLFAHEHATISLCTPCTQPLLTDTISRCISHTQAPIRLTSALIFSNLAGATLRHPVAAPLSEEHTVRLLFTVVSRLSNTAAPPKRDEAMVLMQGVLIMCEAYSDAAMLVAAFEMDLTAYKGAEYAGDGIRFAVQELEKVCAPR